jgi:CheY-like chemotaxis protein
MIVQVLGILAWPVVLLLLAVGFHGPIGKLLEGIAQFSQFKVKAVGIEASITRQQVEVVAALGAATVKQGGDAAGFKAIADALPAPAAQQRMQHSRVLWVDDNPGNNRFERQALEVLGVRVDISTSTAEALARTLTMSYDAIISDMGRDSGLTGEHDPRAGYTLLGRLRERRDWTPFVIYASRSSPELTAEAQAHGAVDSLNQPAALIGLVTRLLQARP